jgi:excisionase family DNA binding protein
MIAVPLADGRWLALETAQFHDALDAARDLGLGPNTRTESPVPDTEPLVDSEQLAGLLGINSTTVEGLAKEGKIPAVRIGRLLRFEPSRVKAALRVRPSL